MADKLVELQEDVRKKERQAMFGRISIGLVHDLSHPIQNIGNSCKLIVKMFDDLEYRENFKRTVERELAQVKRVLDDLRNIARPLPLERFPLDVNKTRRRARRIDADHGGGRRPDDRNGAGVRAALRRRRPVRAESCLPQPDHECASRPRRRAGASSSARSARTVSAVVEVADTGCGIPKERLDTIFDDFVTTKRRGLGLGLAISKKIVEQLGGTISVASEVGVGTTFTLRFPLTQARPTTKLARLSG